MRVPLLDWLRRREAHVEAPSPPARAMSGKYFLLYRYLDDRYANTVVLTFAEIEDLLGFALPEPARVRRDWWTDAAIDVTASSHSDSWTLAHRTAVPNMAAQTVVFERG